MDGADSEPKTAGGLAKDGDEGRGEGEIEVDEEEGMGRLADGLPDMGYRFSVK